jgi:aspartyl-tRNA(Asn)/glutamyl-tRNA(Gln) amidotransferase subunit C
MRGARYPWCHAGATEEPPQETRRLTDESSFARRAEGHRGRANVGRMSAIGPSDVARVATLARLVFSDEETQAMARDLEQILGHVRSLDAVETDGVPPTAHGFELATPLRADEPVAPIDPELAVSNAPERLGTAFLVPKMIEEDG